MQYHRKERVVSTRLDRDTSVLLDLTTHDYFCLNEVGARIWELLPVYDTAEAIAAVLGGDHEAEPGIICHEVAFFLERLHGEGLVGRTAS